MRDCYYTPDGCVVCPELPAVAAQPASAITNPQIGWNAGANSIAQLSGDVHVMDSFATCPNGIVIGFKANRFNQTNPAGILHGLYFYRVGNNAFVEARELGQRVGSTLAYPPGGLWEIRRVGSNVSYWLNNARMAQSPARTLGAVLVNACLYAASDEVP